MCVLDFLYTLAGEDGAVKIWSKSAMLRSVVAQNGRAVYAADWNGAATKVAYCVGDECVIKALNTQVFNAHFRYWLCCI